jgi:NAD(P)-dependent dehydrogenase (short-subunit alcohol dehydrogenase family)
MKLANKVVVITGAAAGIGQAIAARFAKEGATLVLGDIAGEALDAFTGELSRTGAFARGVVSDVGTRDGAERLIDAALDAHGHVDVLVNNAGVLDALTPLLDASDELLERVLAVNLKGPFYTCRKVLKGMIEFGGGNIVNIASLAGIHGGRGGTAYTMSKHGLVGLTKNIAFYYAERGIRSNAICPGGIDTEINKGVTLNEMGLKRASAHFKTTPRAGKAEEIAAAALFLASGEASYVNGSVLVVDGGWTAH